MTQTSPTHYTFGDTELASQRLELLADTFADSSRALLDQVLPTQVDLAIDLGSGLGHTTELLRSLRQPVNTVGYERSRRHLAIARTRYQSLTFCEQDVMLPPFAHSSATVIYSRFLLTHLNAPATAIELWGAALREGGTLVLEEIAHLASPLDEFQRYYAIVADMQAHYGQTLYVGRALNALARRCPLRTRLSRQISFPLSAARMARLHAMNIATWSHDPYIIANYSPSELEALEVSLERIATNHQRLAPVTCTMAQVVLER